MCHYYYPTTTDHRDKIHHKRLETTSHKGRGSTSKMQSTHVSFICYFPHRFYFTFLIVGQLKVFMTGIKSFICIQKKRTRKCHAKQWPTKQVFSFLLSPTIMDLVHKVVNHARAEVIGQIVLLALNYFIYFYFGEFCYCLNPSRYYTQSQSSYVG